MPNKYSQTQVLNMAINPYCKADILIEYPQLKQCVPADISSMVDLNKYFRYAALCFDYQSPMSKEYPDLRQRKERAMEEIGYKGDDYPSINVYFLRNIVRNTTWTLIVSGNEVYNEFTELVHERIKTADKDEDVVMKAANLKLKLLEGMEKIETTKQSLLSRLYEGDADLLEEDRVQAYQPEAMLKRMKK